MFYRKKNIKYVLNNYDHNISSPSSYPRRNHVIGGGGFTRGTVFHERRNIYGTPVLSAAPRALLKHSLISARRALKAERERQLRAMMLSASPVMSRLTSSFTCQLISLIITTLIIHHSFALLLQAQNLPFQQILTTFIVLLPSAFTITGPDRTYHACRFILVRFLFFSVCSVWWTKLATRQLFYCTLNTHYRIVSYRIHTLSPGGSSDVDAWME